MKYITSLSLALVIFLSVSCTDKETDNQSNVNSDSPDVYTDTLTRNSFSEDLEGYRVRINERISDLNADIDSSRAARQAEKNQKKWSDYDTRIAEREARRKDFQERLDRLQTQTENGWQEFKSDMDDLFSRDRSRKDTVRR